MRQWGSARAFTSLADVLAALFWRPYVWGLIVPGANVLCDRAETMFQTMLENDVHSRATPPLDGA